MTKKIGSLAEEVVANFLCGKGFSILAKNVAYPFGEIDLVASHQNTLVFVEVKYRKNLDYGLPALAVSRHKQKRIILAAKAYLGQFEQLPVCRFDVVSLWGDLQQPHIEHLPDAYINEVFF